MSSLMHTIYDVVDASVNHSCHNKSKTLRVKLTVTPEPRSHRRDTGAGEKWTGSGFLLSLKEYKKIWTLILLLFCLQALFLTPLLE